MNLPSMRIIRPRASLLVRSELSIIPCPENGVPIGLEYRLQPVFGV